MYRRIICLSVIVCLIFTGCGVLKSGRSYEEVRKRLLELKDYTCDVTMKVTNNRSTNVYRLKHFYKRTGKYRVEVAAPKELEGQVTIYNGSSSYIYHPGINQYLVTEDFSSSAEYNSFIGSFIEHMDKADGVKTSIEKDGDKELAVLEFEVPEPSNYMRMERLWIDLEAAAPLKAEIYGSDGRKYVEVYYSNFVYNSGLKDEDFEIPNNTIKLQEMKENVRSEENQGCMGGGGLGCTCSQHEGGKKACTEKCPCNCGN